MFSLPSCLTLIFLKFLFWSDHWSKNRNKVDLWAGLVVWHFVLFRVGFCERELQSSGRIQPVQPLKPYVHNEDHLTISIVYKLFASYRASGPPNLPLTVWGGKSSIMTKDSQRTPNFMLGSCKLITRKPEFVHPSETLIYQRYEYEGAFSSLCNSGVLCFGRLIFDAKNFHIHVRESTLSKLYKWCEINEIIHFELRL